MVDSGRADRCRKSARVTNRAANGSSFLWDRHPRLIIFQVWMMKKKKTKRKEKGPGVCVLDVGGKQGVLRSARVRAGCSKALGSK